MYNNPLSPVVSVEALVVWLVLLVHVFAAVLRRHFATVYCKTWELHRRILSAGTCNIMRNCSRSRRICWSDVFMLQWTPP
ncbi:hypothetical protein BDR03DRAFT_943490 [Suillus americanus]|nr:hypothetical protein BDR03DRAFT_943490 [Suillus americanus]